MPELGVWWSLLLCGGLSVWSSRVVAQDAPGVSATESAITPTSEDVGAAIPPQPASSPSTPASGTALKAGRALREAIVVEAGATCLQQDRLVEHVQVWLGRDRVDAGVRVVVRGHEQQRRSALFDITRGGPVHRRSFDALPEICGDAHAVLSLAIALAIDAEVEPQWTGDVTAMAQNVAPQMHVQASLAVELLPDLALGGGFGAMLPLNAWLQLRADALVLHSQNDTIAQSRGRFDATWLGGSLQACAGGELDVAVRFWLCVGGAGAWVMARGEGYAPSRNASSAWLGARSNARLQAHVGLWWSLDLEVFSAFYAPTFQTMAGDQVAFSRASATTGFVLSFGPSLEL